MRNLGILIGFFTLTLFVLPGLTAQEKAKGKDKKDADKADVKGAKDAKDPDTPEPEKKDKKKGVKEKKEKKPVEEIPPHGPVVKTKILSMKPDSVRDFTIEVSMPDPEKMYNIQMWQQQQIASLAKQQFQVRTAQQYAQYMQSLGQFQMQLAQKEANGEGYTNKPVDVQATEACKVRIMYPPLVYDDAGNMKKWTKKEIAALKGTSKLPGFPSDFDMLKPGQFIEVYLAKQHGSSKATKWPGKNGKNGKKKIEKEVPPEDDDGVIEKRPQVIMIVIWGEPKGM